MKSISQWLFTCVLNPVFWALFIVLFFGSVAPANEVKGDKSECVKTETSKDCGKSNECSRRKPVKKLIASLKEKCKNKCRKAKDCCENEQVKVVKVVKVYKPIRIRCCKPRIIRYYARPIRSCCS
tara:strand:+ start:3343 stop:3717 length:375 start_codon:yes stop_codon:yes gene_type:complete